ncbi:glycine-rich cell wall structural protein-like [Coffea eugenioides]|uniref:glycine-rich cell wall structural protein-like n=1 Tax=Coffea eugenioides TaxID=49369 RepID=UPI000F615B14|nr:glycine-rich cell wall structural protein-like [Coffea eugenioides]
MEVVLGGGRGVGDEARVGLDGGCGIGGGVYGGMLGLGGIGDSGGRISALVKVEVRWLHLKVRSASWERRGAGARAGGVGRGVGKGGRFKRRDGGDGGDAGGDFGGGAGGDLRDGGTGGVLDGGGVVCCWSRSATTELELELGPLLGSYVAGAGGVGGGIGRAISISKQSSSAQLGPGKIRASSVGAVCGNSKKGTSSCVDGENTF